MFIVEEDLYRQAAQTPAPFGFRRRPAIPCVALPLQWHRIAIARAPQDLSGAALETRPVRLLQQAPHNYPHSEILHVARVRPEARPKDLDDERLHALAGAVLDLTRRPCRTCGTEIVELDQAGRRLYPCPRCQPA